jgi:hypothetical protein
MYLPRISQINSVRLPSTNEAVQLLAGERNALYVANGVQKVQDVFLDFRRKRAAKAELFASR